MKIVTYKRHLPYVGWIERLGVFFNETTIIDVNHLWEMKWTIAGANNAKLKAQSMVPANLSNLLQVQDDPINFFAQTIENYKELTKQGCLQTVHGAPLALDIKDDKELKFAKPLDRINCYRDFYTHEKHVKKGFEKRAEEVPPEWYQLPVYYKGATAGFIGPEEFIPWPSFTKKLDYELELAAVIGKRGSNIKASQAFGHIFGFTILNDVSARDLQREEMKVRLGPSKGKDFCSVLGPVIITADEFKGANPDLLMTARVNGSEWSRGRSSESHYSWSEMIEFASRDETLYATDLLGSGTVGTGCGLELDQWVKPGDLIELEIEKIGILKNIVGTPAEYIDPHKV